MTTDANASIYHAVPGGSDLVRWFGREPAFHDAEILSLHLCRNGNSTLCVHGWRTTAEIDQSGQFVTDKHVVVIFTLERILDLQLEGFSAQNVISGLILRRAVDRPDRRGYLSGDPRPEDIEIELRHCFGLSGLIRVRSVAITVEPGQPDQRDT